MKSISRFMVICMLFLCIGDAPAVNINWVIVGNAGNADDQHGNGHGGVEYEYKIATYEVTSVQYTEFLNAVAATDTYDLYNIDMWLDNEGCKIQQSGTDGSYTYSVASDMANRPVNFISWYDSLRFINWLHNGQGEGDTEDGAYDMSLGSKVVRKSAAQIWLPSEDEWYKAAYHKNDGVTGNYFDYPIRSDSEPSNILITPDPGNNATFYDVDDGYTIGSPYYRTEVGAHENSESPYGTFDQGGNVWEWNEELIGPTRRGVRGGAYNCFREGLRPWDRSNFNPDDEYAEIGFRVASVVPEPATLFLLGLGGLALRRCREA